MKNPKKTASNNGHLPRRRRRPISEVVPELLEARGLTYNDVERMTKGQVSHSFLSKMISSEPSNPMLNKMIQLSDALDVSVSQLIDEEIAEPEGFRQSGFFKLFLAYQKIKNPKLKKMIDHEIDELLGMMDQAKWAK